MVPGGIPYGYGKSYERTIKVQEGALYSWTIADSGKEGLALDEGGGTCCVAAERCNRFED